MLFRNRLKVKYLSPGEIKVSNVFSVRLSDKESMKRLCESIKKNGIVQPVIVCKQKAGYHIVSGQRRVRAAKLLNLVEIPCLVLPKHSYACEAVMSLVENLEREPLHFFEQAFIMKEALVNNETDRLEMSEKLMLSSYELREKLKLCSLSEREVMLSIENKLKERQITSILRIPAEQRESLINEISIKQLDTEATEKRVRELLELHYIGESKKQIVVKDIRLFLNTVGRAVEIMNEAGISASTTKQEFEDSVVYTVTIPKAKAATIEAQKQNA